MLIAPYQTTKDISECPHLAGREYYTDVQHPELGDKITYPGAWAKISDVPWRISRRAPLIGEHNEEIYEKELGITMENLILLKSRAII